MSSAHESSSLSSQHSRGFTALSSSSFDQHSRESSFQDSKHDPSELVVKQQDHSLSMKHDSTTQDLSNDTESHKKAPCVKEESQAKTCMAHDSLDSGHTNLIQTDNHVLSSQNHNLYQKVTVHEIQTENWNQSPGNTPSSSSNASTFSASGGTTPRKHVYSNNLAQIMSKMFSVGVKQNTTTTVFNKAMADFVACFENSSVDSSFAQNSTKIGYAQDIHSQSKHEHMTESPEKPIECVGDKIIDQNKETDANGLTDKKKDKV